MDKTLEGLAGEYYVLAQLTHRNLVATLTLSNTKGVDILVTNQDLNKLYKVEVKTTGETPKHESLFGPHKFYMWQMSEKHERIVDKQLFYCFVALKGLQCFRNSSLWQVTPSQSTSSGSISIGWTLVRKPWQQHR